MRSNQAQCDACTAKGIDVRAEARAAEAAAAACAARIRPKVSLQLTDRPFSLDETCGDLIAFVKAWLASDKDVLVSDAARRRHAHLLAEFEAHQLSSFRLEKNVPVRSLPLRYLRNALTLWCSDVLYRGKSPSALWSSFVLDTALFLEDLAAGRSFFDEEPGSWLTRLEPLVTDIDADYPCLVADQGLKKRITEQLSGTIVRVELPAGVRLKAYSSRLEDRDSSERLYVGLERCHVSRTTTRPPLTHHTVGAAAKLGALEKEFVFQARLLPTDVVEAWLKDEPCDQLVPPGWAEIPGDWIREEVVQGRQLLPVPTWAPPTRG